MVKRKKVTNEDMKKRNSIAQNFLNSLSYNEKKEMFSLKGDEFKKCMIEKMNKYNESLSKR